MCVRGVCGGGVVGRGGGRLLLLLLLLPFLHSLLTKGKEKVQEGFCTTSWQDQAKLLGLFG